MAKLKIKNYFLSRAAFFKLRYNFWQAGKNAVFLKLIEKKCVQVLSKFVFMKFPSFPSNKNSPRVAKISWRATCSPRFTLWPCLDNSFGNCSFGFQASLKRQNELADVKCDNKLTRFFCANRSKVHSSFKCISKFWIEGTKDKGNRVGYLSLFQHLQAWLKLTAKFYSQHAYLLD